MKKTISNRALKILKKVKRKRPKTIIGHIISHGYITTEEIKRKYGYDHPPRAARDVREEGIPLETFNAQSSGGRKIAAYRFGDLNKLEKGKIGGRKAFPKKTRDLLISRNESKCVLCAGRFDARLLQIDHRIPYEISGDMNFGDFNSLMVLCRSCNRAKSWSCEHCINWREGKNIDLCRACYWSGADNYKHAALMQIRRCEVVWTESEIEIYEKLSARARNFKLKMPEYVKIVLEKNADREI
jgi:hypothetical protein